MPSDEDVHKVSQEELQHHFSREDAYFHELEQQRLFAAKQRQKKRRMISHNEGCPSDGCLLEHVTLHGVVVDRCPICRGVWIDAHEIEEILRGLEKEHKKPDGFLKSLAEALRPTP